MTTTNNNNTDLDFQNHEVIRDFVFTRMFPQLDEFSATRGLQSPSLYSLAMTYIIFRLRASGASADEIQRVVTGSLALSDTITEKHKNQQQRNEEARSKAKNEIFSSPNIVPFQRP